MVVFPCCKINLGLHVISRRADGYHDLETCFYPVPWCDALEVIPAPQPSFQYSGRSIEGASGNLCERAFQLLKDNFNVPEILLHLHKVIPMGAGLGGGSSDAAAMLTLLNNRFELKIPSGQLSQLAASLGSDCAFFLNRASMLGTGRGDILSPSTITLKDKVAVIVYPEFAISTKEAFQLVRPHIPRRPLSSILGLAYSEWKQNLVNDFENALFPKYPVLHAVKQRLYDLGAWYASMSGSGSAIVGLFDKPPAIKNEFANMTVWSGTLN
jgi:4-diphosphocytidyl-2-C-methyl-D-erythritol kinase